MMQVVVQAPPPLPPVPPGLDPTFAFLQVLEWVGPIAMLVVFAIGLKVLLRSPVGEAIAERIRHGLRRRDALTGESAEQVALLEEQVHSLRTEVSDLAERLDFAERVLAKRAEPRLGAGQ